MAKSCRNGSSLAMGEFIANLYKVIWIVALVTVLLAIL
jgi:hypothetical protein